MLDLHADFTAGPWNGHSDHFPLWTRWPEQHGGWEEYLRGRESTPYDAELPDATADLPDVLYVLAEGASSVPWIRPEQHHAWSVYRLGRRDDGSPVQLPDGSFAYAWEPDR